jgi:serine protease Do
VKAPNELQSMIAGKHPGEKVTLKIWRDKKTMEKSVALKARNEKANLSVNNDQGDDEDRPSTTKNLKPIQFDDLGFSVTKADAKIRKERKVDSEVLVSDVKRYSEADNRQMQAGDIIVEADRREVTSVPEFEKLVKAKKPGDALMLRVRSANGTSRFIAVQIPKD